MKTILFLAFLAPIWIFAQNGPLLNWDLQYSDTRINTGTDDIGLIINGITLSSEDYENIEVIADQFSDKIKSKTIGFSNGELLIKLAIEAGKEVIGRDRILLIRRADLNTVVGHIKIPIGGKRPFIEAAKSYGTLRIGTNEPSSCTFGGSNLDGISEVITSDNKVVVESIVGDMHGLESMEVILKPNDDEQSYRTKFKFKYQTFDSATKDIVSKTTSDFEAGIQLRNSSVISLIPDRANFFISDIISAGGELTILISKNDAMLEAVDFRTIQPVQGDFISGNSSVDFNSENSGTLHLFFDNYEKLSAGRTHINLKTTGSVAKEYKVALNLLRDPEVEEVYGKDDDLKFIISKQSTQTLKVKGERLKDLLN